MPTYFLGGYLWEADSELLSFNGNYIKVTKNEIKIISTLLKNTNKYLKPCDIHELVFNKTGEDDCNNVVQLISRLKKKFKKLNFSRQFFIQNNYGLGYKLILT